MGRRRASPFVGRAAELAVLDGLFRALPDHGAAAALVAGEAGMGKSRLVGELRTRAEQAGALVGVGRTPAAGSSLPYGVVVGLVRDLARKVAGRLGAERLQPAQELLLGSAADSGDPGPFARLRLFESMLDAIGTLAESQSVVLVLEDLHWADTGSIELLDHLVRSLDEQAVLIVGTYRPADMAQRAKEHRMMSELRNHYGVTPLDLQGLSRSEVSELLAGGTGTAPPWTVVDAVFRRSEGNPFFAEELGEIRDERSLPPALRDLLRLRVAQLSPPARRLTGALSILGATSEPSLLAALLDDDDMVQDASLTEAVDQGVLVIEPGTSTIRFRHALLRDATEEELLPSERVRLHRRAAAALEAHPATAGAPQLAAELAEHHYGAGDWPAACAASIRAAEAALTLYSVQAAHEHLTRAVDAHRRAGGACDHPEVGDDVLLRRAAEAAYWSNNLEAGAELARQAMAALPDDPQPAELAPLASILARCATNTGDDELAFRIIDEAEAVLRSLPEGPPLAQIVTMRCRLFMLGQNESAIAVAEEAIALSRRVGDRVSEGHALATLGPCLAEIGDHDRAYEAVVAGVEIAESMNDPDLLLRVYTNYTHVLATAGRIAEVADYAVDAARQPGPRALMRLGSAGVNAVQALLYLGRWQEAEELDSLLVGRALAVCTLDSTVPARLAIRRGRFDEAEAHLARGRYATTINFALRDQARAELALARGEPEAAAEAAERAVHDLSMIDSLLDSLLAIATWLAALGDIAARPTRPGRRAAIDPEKLRRQTDELVAEADSLVAPHRERGPLTTWMAALLSRCHAEASRVRGPDPSAWRTAAAAWAAFGEPFEEASSRYRLAEALLAGRGDRGEAAAELQKAWRAATELGGAPLVARCEQLAQRARLTIGAEQPASPRDQAASDLGLTAREVEVLDLLALGRSDGQIADQLFISKKTASVHVSNILRKLDAGDRWQAGELGREAGLGAAPSATPA